MDEITVYKYYHTGTLILGDDGGAMGVAYLDEVLDGSSHSSYRSGEVFNDLTILSFFVEDDKLGHLK